MVCLWYGIQIWTDLSSALSQFTRLTDGRTHSMQRGKKIGKAFLPRCMQCRRGLAMRILSVRLSVCQIRDL